MSSIINTEEYIGKIYNNYTIVSFEYFKKYNNRSRQAFYKCICKCGKESVIGLWGLKLKRMTMCNNCKSIMKTLPNGEAAINAVFTQYIRQAKNRNYTFEISKDYFLEIVNKNCYYCNAPPSNTARNQNKTGTYMYNGIDRVNNTKGYNKDNIVPCCLSCNRAKSDMELNDFKQWIINIYNKIINE